MPEQPPQLWGVFMIQGCECCPKPGELGSVVILTCEIKLLLFRLLGSTSPKTPAPSILHHMPNIWVNELLTRFKPLVHSH